MRTNKRSRFVARSGCSPGCAGGRRLLAQSAWLVLLTLGLMLSSCLPQPSRLRITNQSACPLHNLIVFFPRDRIRFGDVPAGATTGYQVVPNGVFACAAYELDVEGQTLAQPVIDWVGAASLPGKAFTYYPLCEITFAGIESRD